MIVLLIISIIIVGVLGYTTWNLYRKVTRQEDIIEYQVGYLRKVAYLINESKIYVEQLDEKGAFRSDDEVGVFFNFMKEIQETINAYRLPDDYGKTDK
jgi:heme/copper-type cytochrome/quinol oxidase subunit 2